MAICGGRKIAELKKDYKICRATVAKRKGGPGLRAYGARIEPDPWRNGLILLVGTAGFEPATSTMSR